MAVGVGLFKGSSSCGQHGAVRGGAWGKVVGASLLVGHLSPTCFLILYQLFLLPVQIMIFVQIPSHRGASRPSPTHLTFVLGGGSAGINVRPTYLYKLE